jgi:molecular chaperone DnaK (HSP70)
VRLSQDILQIALAPCRRALKDANLTASQVDEVDDVLLLAVTPLLSLGIDTLSVVMTKLVERNTTPSGIDTAFHLTTWSRSALTPLPLQG